MYIDIQMAGSKNKESNKTHLFAWYKSKQQQTKRESGQELQVRPT